jgi:hypothetical protein
MADSIVKDRLAGVHPQMVRAQSETERKKVADLRLVVGRLVERALELAGLSKQETAFAIGYSDAGTISRWCSGIERPLFDKLFTVPGFQEAYVLALAEGNPRMDVETIVTIRRVA